MRTENFLDNQLQISAALLELARKGKSAKEPDPDLSIAQIRVLILVARSVPSRLTIKQLGQLLQLSPAATSKLIDRIVRHDMIRRIPSESDRRSYYLELTPRSREMIRHHNRAGKALFDRLLCQVPQEDKETFVRVSCLFNKGLWSLLTQQETETAPRKGKPRLSSSIPSSSIPSSSSGSSRHGKTVPTGMQKGKLLQRSGISSSDPSGACRSSVKDFS